MRDRKKMSLTVVAGTTNRLLDVLIAALIENGWRVARIQQLPIMQGSRLLIWTRHLTGAFSDLIKIFCKRSTVAFHFYGVRSFAISVILSLIRWDYVIHFWGSDYFYWRSRSNFLLRYALRNAKCVTFANSEMLSDARSIFGEDINFELLRFGLEALDFIDARGDVERRKSDLIRVVVGTNSQINQQHEKIIYAIEELDRDLLDRCCFVFPLNYGDRNNRIRVIEKLSKSKFRYEVLDDYIGGAKVG